MKDRAIKGLLLTAASASLLIIVLIFFFLGREAFFFFFNESGAQHLFATRWNPVSFGGAAFGFAPLLCGSLVVTFFALIFTVPLSLIFSMYLAELARETEREIVKPFVELLASVPSVVIGFFGITTVAPVLKQLLGLSSGLTALTGGVILSIMAMPTIVTLTEDALRAVPESYRAASLALGANRVQTVFRVVFPAALPGIMAAILLGVGRVLGETMAVMMVTGNAPQITLSPVESVRTMTATIAAEMGEVARGSQHYHALFALGVVLLLITMSLNIIGKRMIGRRLMRSQGTRS